MSKIVLEIKNLCKSYIENGERIQILKDINFSLEYGKSLAILGQSGCGKTTLLQIIGLIDDFDSGEIIIDGTNIKNLNEKEKNNFLSRKISFVHQFHHLFPEFTAIENIIFPQINIGMSKKDAIEHSMEILKSLGLENKANVNPWHLSGGERQRIAMARAISTNPKIILADEPTGNLDPKNSKIALELLISLCNKKSSSLVLVTHNHELAKMCDCVIVI